MSLLSEICNKLTHPFLQRNTTSNNGTYGNNAISMKSLEVFQITVKKRIFVVPLYFKSKSKTRKNFHMINFMRNGLFFQPINYFLYFKLMLFPFIGLTQLSSDSLCQLAFTAATTNQFFSRNRNVQKYGFQLIDS